MLPTDTPVEMVAKTAEEKVDFGISGSESTSSAKPPHLTKVTLSYEWVLVINDN